MSRVTVPYVEMLRERLRDPALAAAYLDAALEDGDPEVCLLALSDVAGACGLSAVAQECQLNDDYTLLRDLLNDHEKLEDYLDYLHMQQVKGESSVRFSLADAKQMLGLTGNPFAPDDINADETSA